MKIAFTGPSTLYRADYDKVAAVLDTIDSNKDTIITGACIGLDTYVAEYCHTAGFEVHTIVPANRAKVAYDWERWCHTHDLAPDGAEPYRIRNTLMVEKCDRLIAFFHSIGRNGETMTRNIALRMNKPVLEVML